MSRKKKALHVTFPSFSQKALHTYPYQSSLPLICCHQKGHLQRGMSFQRNNNNNNNNNNDNDDYDDDDDDDDDNNNNNNNYLSWDQCYSNNRRRRRRRMIVMIIILVGLGAYQCFKRFDLFTSLNLSAPGAKTSAF